MEEYTIKIEQLMHRFDEKKNKKLQTEVFHRLCKKLVDVEDFEISELISQTYKLLSDLSRDDQIKTRSYSKIFSKLKSLVRKKLDLTPRGTLKEESIGIGIAIGSGLGAGFLSINPAFMGIGIPIGLAIGVAIGTRREKDAEAAGKTY